MPPRDDRTQRGLSIVEVLVAITILVLTTTAALVVYDAGWHSVKNGENATEQQQMVRISFDRLKSDLQLAGLNYNPDGTARPDEQIEAAYDTAVVVRADFDIQDPARNRTPEDVLAGGAFDWISTGNDEIVVYVLAKPDGSSVDTLTFDADVKDSPRDGVVETVSIPDVALVHDDPPYTLYRISLNNDTGTWGSPDFLVRTPIAENVRSLSLRYYDSSGAQINAFDLSQTADDIGGGETPAARRDRSRIHRIELDLEGLTRDPDLYWKDPDDADPDTWAFRKFQLRGDVSVRNVGMIGVEDLPAN